MHFVVLHAAYKAHGPPLGRITAFTWKDTFIREQDLAWSKSVLASSDAPTIILVHQLLQVPPANLDPALVATNVAQVRAILNADKQVLDVFQGHYHHESCMVLR